MPTFIDCLIEVFDQKQERELVQELVGLAVNNQSTLISLKITGDGYGPDETFRGSKPGE